MHLKRLRRVSVPTISTVLLLTWLSGCKVTAEDIDYWKGTVKGPGKIVAVMLADRYPMDLRTKAAVALVEMERQDKDGVGLLQEAVVRLQGSDGESATQIIDGMVPRLQELMRGGDQAQNEELGGPPPIQIRAKDASYLLVQHASPQSKQQLIGSVVDWYTTDFANRSLAGNYSVEQVVRSIGAPAADRLVNAMNSRQPQQALVKIAEMVGQLGNDETKNRGGERLVEIEREMEGDEFLEWLRSQIRESLESQGRTANESRVNIIAEINRENFINDGVLPAMKQLAANDSVRQRLMEIASAMPPARAPAEQVEAINLRRQKALMALEGNATQAELDALLALALNERNPINVRDYAFDRVGDVRSPAAIPRLWPLVQTSENDALKKRLRWRAGELVLAIGGSEIVGQFFAKLPAGEVQYEPEELEGYATRMSQMTPVPDAILRRQLSSANWFARVIALRFLERRGTEQDVRNMQRLRRDNGATSGEGWARREMETVGKVAEASITSLRERLAEPDAAMQASAME